MKLILDTSALLSGFQPNKCYTVREVIDEVREKNARLRISLSLEGGSLRLVEPEEENLLEIKEAALESGDIAKLSDTDIKLLSVALHFKKKRFKPVIITDDYNIQNLAGRLGMEFSPTTEAGIKKILTWKKICKGCGKRFPIEYQGSCDVCGTRVSKIAEEINL